MESLSRLLAVRMDLDRFYHLASGDLELRVVGPTIGADCCWVEHDARQVQGLECLL